MARLVMLASILLLMCTHPQPINIKPLCPHAFERKVTDVLVLKDKESYTREEIRAYVSYIRKKLLLKNEYIKNLEIEIECLKGDIDA